MIMFMTQNRPGPEVIKLFSCSTQLSMKFVMLTNLRLLTMPNSFLLNKLNMKISLLINMKMPTLVVCVEVLRPSQPNGVMSSAVSLPNHTFTGQA